MRTPPVEVRARFTVRGAVRWSRNDRVVIASADFVGWSTLALAVATFALVVVSVLQFHEARSERQAGEKSLKLARDTLAAQQRPTLIEAPLDLARAELFELLRYGQIRPHGGEVLAAIGPHGRGIATLEVLNVGHGPAVVRATRIISFDTLPEGGEAAYWPGPDERLVLPVDRPTRLSIVLDEPPQWWRRTIEGRTKFWIEVRFTDIDGGQEQSRYFEIRPRATSNEWHVGEISSEHPRAAI